MFAEDFVRLLEQIPQRIASMDHKDALEATVPEVHAGVGKNYGRQVDGDGVPWPPRKDDLPHPLLILSSAMLGASTGGSGAIVQYRKDGVDMGIESSVVPYAKAQNYGYAPTNLPAREYYYLHPEDRQGVVQKFGIRTSQSFRKQVLRKG